MAMSINPEQANVRPREEVVNGPAKPHGFARRQGKGKKAPKDGGPNSDGQHGAVSQTNLFIKNLPPKFGNEDLKRIFAKFGQITSCVVILDEEGASRHYGFVHFASPQDANAAVASMDGSILSGRKLIVQHAQVNAKAAVEDGSRSSVFISHLPDIVNDQMLIEMFQCFGTIIHANVVLEPTGISRGFGFVTYSKPDEAVRAVEGMREKTFNGQHVYVALSHHTEPRPQTDRLMFGLNADHYGYAYDQGYHSDNPPFFYGYEPYDDQSQFQPSEDFPYTLDDRFSTGGAQQQPQQSIYGLKPQSMMMPADNLGAFAQSYDFGPLSSSSSSVSHPLPNSFSRPLNSLQPSSLLDVEGPPGNLQGLSDLPRSSTGLPPLSLSNLPVSNSPFPMNLSVASVPSVFSSINTSSAFSSTSSGFSQSDFGSMLAPSLSASLASPFSGLDSTSAFASTVSPLLATTTSSASPSLLGSQPILNGQQQQQQQASIFRAPLLPAPTPLSLLSTTFNGSLSPLSLPATAQPPQPLLGLDLASSSLHSSALSGRSPEPSSIASLNDAFAQLDPFASVPSRLTAPIMPSVAPIVPSASISTSPVVSAATPAFVQSEDAMQLTIEKLAAIPEDHRRQAIGDHFYANIDRFFGPSKYTGKITALLLEFAYSDILLLVQDINALRAASEEALRRFIRANESAAI